MPITYDVANNRINVTGYTLAVPCNFTDLYNADKAGTYSLHTRTGIAGADGAPVAVTNALRPADYVVLGGTVGGDLYIVVTNWTANATINVVGTDRDGTAQNENIAVTANGTYNLTLWYKTVVSTQVTAFAGAFDYDLQQGQWGVVWNTGSQFSFNCRIRLGNYSDATYFADTDKQIEFQSTCGAGGGRCFDINNPVTFQLGTLLDAGTKSVSQGCAVLSHVASEHYLIYGYDSDVYLYDSLFHSPNGIGVKVKIRATGSAIRMYHCVCSSVYPNGCDGCDFYGLYLTAVDYGIRSCAGAFDRIECDNNNYGARTWSNWVMALSNAIFRNPITDDIRNWDITVDQDFTNITCGWDVTFGGTCTANLNRHHTFNLRVVDSAGVGIQGVTVNMDDRLGANVFNVATDASGDIAEQTILYGYYDQANGSTIQPNGLGYSPHTITISKAGYAPRTIVYEMDRAREEIEKLGGAAPHGYEYRRRRVPVLVSALAEYE